MSNIYELLKKAEDSKRPKGEGEEMPILEIRDLEIEKASGSPGPGLEEVLGGSQEPSLPEGESISLPAPCLIEMTRDIKKALDSMFRSSLLGLEKVNDPEVKRLSRTSVMRDYKKIDLVLKLFLSYVRMSQPVAKKDTIHAILEELLAGYQKELQDRSIVLTKDYHHQLLETTLHEEQLKFILGTVLQYAVLSASGNGEISVMTKPVLVQRLTEEEKIVPLKGRYSEVSIRWSFLGEPGKDSGRKPEEGLRSVLLIVRELLQKNQGNFEFQVDPRVSKKYITLRFPAERRQSFYYRPVLP